MLENIFSWELAGSEHFLRAGHHRERIWMKSKLAGLISEALFPAENDSYYYDLSQEPPRSPLKLSIFSRKKSKKQAAIFCSAYAHRPGSNQPAPGAGTRLCRPAQHA